MHFDGVDDFLSFDQVAPSLAASANFTIEFWMKADFNENTANPRVNLFTINPPAPGENKFAILLGNSGTSQSGHLSIFETAGQNFYLTSDAIIGDKQCHHIAYIRNGNTGEAFVDGNSIGTLAVGTALTTKDRISIGQDWDDLLPSDFYKGYIDGFRLWSVARTKTQLVNEMNRKLTGNENGLLCYYDFDQGTANGSNTNIPSVLDKSPNQYHASIRNFALNGDESNWVGQAFAPDLNLGIDTNICIGQTLILNGGLASDYLWSDGTKANQLPVSSTSSYWLVASNGACTNSDTIHVNVDPVLNSAYKTDTFCRNQGLTLNAFHASVTKYAWDDGSGENQLSVHESGEYFVERTNACGTSQLQFHVEEIECPCTVYLPNCFTPNSDPKNPTFGPSYSCDFDSFKMEIYDRWGELLFKTNSPLEAWDGTNKQGLVSDGIYSYLLEYTSAADPSKKKTYSGHVTLIK